MQPATELQRKLGHKWAVVTTKATKRENQFAENKVLKVYTLNWLHEEDKK